MKINPLGDLSLGVFLAEYWQKKPLLIRQALPGINPPIAADELAGLACEEEVESRLICQDPTNEQWELTHGPFTDATFSALPNTHWTLLVRAFSLGLQTRGVRWRQWFLFFDLVWHHFSEHQGPLETMV